MIQRQQTRALFFMALVLACLHGCSEALPIASGALEGKVSAIPSAWGPVAQDEIIQLETNGPEGPTRSIYGR